MAEREKYMDLLNSLQTVAWAEDNFGSLITNRRFRRSKALSLIKRGFVKSIGPVAPMDEDCSFIEGAQKREGFVLTDYGKDCLEQLEAKYEESLKTELKQKGASE